MCLENSISLYNLEYENAGGNKNLVLNEAEEIKKQTRWVETIKIKILKLLGMIGMIYKISENANLKIDKKI